MNERDMNGMPPIYGRIAAECDALSAHVRELTAQLDDIRRERDELLHDYKSICDALDMTDGYMGSYVYASVEEVLAGILGLNDERDKLRAALRMLWDHCYVESLHCDSCDEWISFATSDEIVDAVKKALGGG